MILTQVLYGRSRNARKAGLKRGGSSAAIYDGGTRSDAAKIGGVGLQIVRGWVLRFNANGPVWPH